MKSIESFEIWTIIEGDAQRATFDRMQAEILALIDSVPEYTQITNGGKRRVVTIPDWVVDPADDRADDRAETPNEQPTRLH